MLDLVMQEERAGAEEVGAQGRALPSPRATTDEVAAASSQDGSSGDDEGGKKGALEEESFDAESPRQEEDRGEMIQEHDMAQPRAQEAAVERSGAERRKKKVRRSEPRDSGATRASEAAVLPAKLESGDARAREEQESRRMEEVCCVTIVCVKWGRGGVTWCLQSAVCVPSDG